MKAIYISSDSESDVFADGSRESSVSKDARNVLGDGLFSNEFSSNVFIEVGGFFEGFVFTVKFIGEVVEVVLSDTKEDFLSGDSSFSGVDFTEGDVKFSGDSLVVIGSFLDFLLELGNGGGFVGVFEVEGVEDTLFDVFEGVDDSEDGTGISEFGRGEGNQSFDEGFFDTSLEFLGDGVDGVLDSLDLDQRKGGSSEVTEDFEAFVDGGEGVVVFGNSDFVGSVGFFSFVGDSFNIGVVFVDFVIVRFNGGL